METKLTEMSASAFEDKINILKTELQKYNLW